jgi:hypothetical protein
MKLKLLKNLLLENQNSEVVFAIDNHQVPSHYHITEVGKVNKIFLDCGGTKREETTCVLQLWVANDIDHRLKLSKIISILELADGLFDNENPDVFIEYEKDIISQYPISGFEINNDKLEIRLGKKHTACLAPDKCGVSCCDNNREYIVNLLQIP